MAPSLVDGGPDVVVVAAGLFEGVADGGEADPARDSECAHHVQDDSGLPLGIPTEPALGDDGEQIVHGQTGYARESRWSVAA